MARASCIRRHEQNSGILQQSSTRIKNYGSLAFLNCRWICYSGCSRPSLEHGGCHLERIELQETFVDCSIL